ncbi:hypothetical protein B0A48_13856 [Cryoendolithus antarcticus]|uniref:G-patch domain-containing protein n=1 Tax=Cryoendolithus antarcticus TaxID=1507870 RepID=A0A1V8SMW5_9PEZI|nr:hypothetical protein B0A48_13856 [Cryoendolithus antarcticus]
MANNPDMPTKPETTAPVNAEEDEEDDYLSMTFATTPAPKESSLQRTARLKKESLARSQLPSKQEKEAAATLAREKALATSLLNDALKSKAASMMAKMGFTPGSALGAKGNEGRLTPLEVSLREGKSGIGLEGERKRKVREELLREGEKVKRMKETEGEWRERVAREREEKRVEGAWWGGMKVLEGLAEGDGGTEGGDVAKLVKARKVHLLHRPLVKSRIDAESERRARYDMHQSLSRNVEQTEEDADDKLAFGSEVEDLEDEEDAELEGYEALPVAERLDMVVKHLRSEYRYCFWCKHRYDDEEMEGCPGLTEDEHG